MLPQTQNITCSPSNSDEDLKEGASCGSRAPVLFLDSFKRMNTPTPESKELNEWTKAIKTGKLDGIDYSNVIIQARTEVELNGKTSKRYKRFKHQLPAIAWNFTFEGNKSNSSIKEATGLIYYDIDADKLPEYKETVIPFIKNKSLSNTGLALVYKVEGLTLDNFGCVYDGIAKELGIYNIYDKMAKKATQYTVLSLDASIQLYSQSKVFKAKDYEELVIQSQRQAVLQHLKKKNKESGKVQSSITTNRQIQLKGQDCTFLKENNLDEITPKEGFISNKDGLDIIKLWVPSTRYKGFRSAYLLACAANLVFLNPPKAAGVRDAISQRLLSLNAKFCSPPMTSREVNDILDRTIKKGMAGELKPIVFLKRGKSQKVAFGSKSHYELKDKQSIGAIERNRWAKENTFQAIYNAIEAAECKITQKMIAEITGKSIRTIKNYWGEFVQFVKDKNQRYFDTLVIEKTDPANIKQSKEVRGNSSHQVKADHSANCETINREAVNNLLVYTQQHMEEEWENLENPTNNLTVEEHKDYREFCEKYNAEYATLLLSNYEEIKEVA